MSDRRSGIAVLGGNIRAAHVHGPVRGLSARRWEGWGGEGGGLGYIC